MGRDPRARAQVRSRTLPDGNLLVDTNIFVRYLTGQPKDQYRRVKRLFDDRIPLTVTDTVIAETIYVLESIHRQERRTIAELIRSLVAEPNVYLDRRGALLFATDVYELTNLDWVDSYLVGSASTSKVTRVLSFDKGIDKIKGIRAEP